MSLAQNIFEQAVKRSTYESSNSKPRQTAFHNKRGKDLTDLTPRTSRVKGFIGDIENVLGRYGTYGQYRTETLSHTLQKSRSNPNLRFNTKVSFRKSRKLIGNSNRNADPLQLKKYTKKLQRLQTSHSVRMFSNCSSLVQKQKRTQYQTQSVEFALTKRKKLGIEISNKQRPKSYRGYYAPTHKYLRTQKSNRERIQKNKRKKKKEREKYPLSHLIFFQCSPFHTSTTHSSLNSCSLEFSAKETNDKSFNFLSKTADFNTEQNSCFKQIQKERRQSSQILYKDLLAIQEKRKYDTVNDLLSNSLNADADGDMLYKHNKCKNLHMQSYLNDKERNRSLLQIRQSKLKQNQEKWNACVIRKRDKFEKRDQANVDAIRKQRKKYHTRIKEQTTFENNHKWVARRIAFSQFSPTKKLYNKRKFIKKPFKN